MQIYGDPDAADVVFTSGADIVVIGINLTTQLKLTGMDCSLSSYRHRVLKICELTGVYLCNIFSESDLLEIRDAKGRFGKYVYDMCTFYKNWHFESDGLEGEDSVHFLVLFSHRTVFAIV